MKNCNIRVSREMKDLLNRVKEECELPSLVMSSRIVAKNWELQKKNKRMRL